MFNMALNHIIAPQLDAESFCVLAAQLGCDAIEVRMDTALNDEGGASTGPTPTVLLSQRIQNFSAQAEARGMAVIALSELSAFDVWNTSRAEQATRVTDYAVAANIPAINLIPSNDGAIEHKSERMARLRAAMLGIKPILDERGLLGLIEPLGFETASLRMKDEIVEMIEELDLSGHFKLIHDTFHHALAGGGPVYADHTALVHISGIDDQTLDFKDMRDGDRGLVTQHDRLGTVAQVKQLRDAGYRGPISFEPFAKSVQQADDLEAQLSKSIHFIEDQLQLSAA